MLPEYFVFVGIFLNILGLISYFIDTIKGNIRPNRVSLAIWALAPYIIFFAQIKEGVGTSAIMTLSAALLTTFIFVATFVNKKAYWKLKKFDFICGALSLFGLVLWQMTKVGDLAILFSILADFLATIPTIVKAYRFPKTEPTWPWLAISTNGLFALLVIKSWTFANFAFPLYFFLSTITIFFIVKYKPKKLLAKTFHSKKR